MRTFLLLILTSLCLSACKSWQQSDKPRSLSEVYRNLPKSIKKELDAGFVLVDEGTFLAGKVQGADTFSAMLSQRRITVPALFIGKHEVTVAEFMEFYDYFRDSINKPDTLCFLKDFPYLYNEPALTYYFCHPKYRIHKYPVCGVSLEQAKKFCVWKTNTMNARLKTMKGFENMEVVFRLPTAYELEYAISLEIPPNFKDAHPVLSPYDNLQNCNTKGVVDENNILHTLNNADGFSYTAPVGYYQPNDKGFYDIRGNVAEWTITNAFMLTSKLKFENTSFDIVTDNLSYWGIDSSFYKLKSHPHYNKMLEIVTDSNYYLTKGGSFAHGAYYTQSAAFIPVQKSENHSWLGFRLVLVVFNRTSPNAIISH